MLMTTKTASMITMAITINMNKKIKIMATVISLDKNVVMTIIK